MFVKSLVLSAYLLHLSISSASAFLSKFNLPPWNLRSLNEKECVEYQWKCQRENKCLDMSQICNGKNDCQEGDDEATDLCTRDFCWNELGHWKCPGDSKVAYLQLE